MSNRILSIFTFSRRKRDFFSQNPIILGYEKLHFPAGAKGNYKYVGAPTTDMFANREPVMLERCEPTGGDLRFRVIIAMGISKISRKKRFFALLRNEVRRPKRLKAMTKQRFVIGEFISVTMNEPMLFCFVIGEFISVTMNEPMLFCFVIGEFISVTMNEPMLFCFVIDEFCSNRSHVALPPLRQ